MGLIGLNMGRANACLSRVGTQCALTVRYCTCSAASDNALATSTIVLDRVSLPNPLSCPDCFWYMHATSKNFVLGASKGRAAPLLPSTTHAPLRLDDDSHALRLQNPKMVPPAVPTHISRRI